jgi:2-polyprenyl-6-methoxyphenol hydroxylase-like FAD-dependent oxidoreductase
MTTSRNTHASGKLRALVSGAGFAGLTAAFWLHRLGYEVTIVG